MRAKAARSTEAVPNSSGVTRVRSGVTIIGLGNWGTSLNAALVRAGIPEREIVVRTMPRSTKTTRALPLRLMSDAALDARILWICVPDSAIETVAADLVRRRPNLSGQIVIHSSGALDCRVLASAEGAGAAAASIHPVMSFPARRPESLEGVLFGVEARARIRSKLFSLLRNIHGQPFTIGSEDKAMYHAAGTLASPLLLSALTAAVGTAQAAGLSPRHAKAMVAALAQATLRNFIERGAEQSFSGPFARGDAFTIDLHLTVLEAHPILAKVYQSLALQALEALPVRHRDELQRMLNRKRPGRPALRRLR